jgi:hypothetical protein
MFLRKRMESDMPRMGRGIIFHALTNLRACDRYSDCARRVEEKLGNRKAPREHGEGSGRAASSVANRALESQRRSKECALTNPSAAGGQTAVLAGRIHLEHCCDMSNRQYQNYLTIGCTDRPTTIRGRLTPLLRRNRFDQWLDVFSAKRRSNTTKRGAGLP